MATALFPTGRRIQAAMRLAGLTFDDLAERIGEEGLGSRTLRKLADDDDTSRTPQKRDLVVIAEACEVPYAFFTVDFSHLGEPTDTARLDALEAKVEELRQTLALEALRRVAAENGPAVTHPGEGPRRTSSGGSGQ